jgi:UPF0271 protein
MIIDINCDMGEGMATDTAIMPFISSANIACGFHAGDDNTMRETVSLAIQYGVTIGAHPGYADKENFGRTEMHVSDEEVYALIQQQVAALMKIAAEKAAKLHHVKPHGALYNQSAKDPQLAAVIAKAVYDIDPALVLFGLSGSHSISEAKKIGLTTASEVFADRSYQDDGSLTPRSKPGALLQSTEAALQQVLQMVNEKTVTSLTGKKVLIDADTICLHGDGAHAADFAKAIYQLLQQHSVHIQSVLREK